ncbi:hypothetical protein GPALN_006869 [Globodera pallida]|nr:hypothetical protein GPALN_006869 [Globodera pallida]
MAIFANFTFFHFCVVAIRRASHIRHPLLGAGNLIIVLWRISYVVHRCPGQYSESFVVVCKGSVVDCCRVSFYIEYADRNNTLLNPISENLERFAFSLLDYFDTAYSESFVVVCKGSVVDCCRVSFYIEYADRNNTLLNPISENLERFAFSHLDYFDTAQRSTTGLDLSQLIERAR